MKEKLNLRLLWNCSGEASNELNAGNRKKVEDYIASRVGEMTCPVHGEAATIVCKGTRLDALTFDVQACCQKHAFRVREKLES
jgi:hypothetical protein